MFFLTLFIALNKIMVFISLHSRASLSVRYNPPFSISLENTIPTWLLHGVRANGVMTAGAVILMVVRCRRILTVWWRFFSHLFK